MQNTNTDRETMISTEVLRDCFQRYDSFYLYDETTILEQAERLKTTFPQIRFLYSIKCNCHPAVLESVFAQGFGADAASAGEVNLAQNAGLAAEDIYYSAPGKSDRDLQRTFGRSVLIADSLEELGRIRVLAAQAGQTAAVGLRIHPEFSFAGERGGPSKFGIDAEAALSFLRESPPDPLRITGIHVHLKSQELCAGTLAGYYRRVLALSEEFHRICGELQFVNLGSGMGIPYAPTDVPLNLDALAGQIGAELDRYQAAHPGTKILMETGRYVVGESGIYATKVLDRKVSRGRTYLILHNTMNGFLRPCLAKLIADRSSHPSPASAEPLFTSAAPVRFLTLKEDTPTETVTLVGNLCTGSDVIAEDLTLPRLERGDAVILTGAGAYAAVLSPMQFSSQDPPAELFLCRSGEIVCRSEDPQKG